MGTAAIHRHVRPEEYRDLGSLADSALPVAGRARVVLAVLRGRPPATVAREAGLPRTTVYSWVRRFAVYGVGGLHNRGCGERVGVACCAPRGYRRGGWE